MLEVRAPAYRTLAAVRAERVPGAAVVAPSHPAADRTVRLVHVLDEGPIAATSISAARSYLSSGLASTDSPVIRLGWLIDIRA